MSTKTKTEPDLQLIPTSKIAAVPGFNPRGEFSRDSDEFKSLKASIKERGIETPIKVGAPDKDGIHPIIYGHRRHAAAAELGLELTPALVDTDLDEKQRYIAAIVENRERSEMSPVAEAEALRVLREDLGLKQAEAAQVMAMSERSARNRQAILDLPDEARNLLNAGKLPLEAAVHLAPIARTIPALVELIVSTAAEEEDLDQLADKENVGMMIEQLAPKAGLQPIHDHTHESSSLTKLAVTAEQRKELQDLYSQVPKPRYGNRPGFHFGDTAAKAAKESGQLFEFTFERWGVQRTARFITSFSLVFELAKPQLPAIIKKATKAVETEKLIHGSSADPQSSSEDRDKAAEKAEKKRRRAEAMVAKANEELAEKLAALKNPKATDLDIVKMFVRMALGDEPAELVGNGLGRLYPNRYGDEEERERWGDEKLLEELAGAKNAAECLGIGLRAMLARRHVLDPREADRPTRLREYCDIAGMDYGPIHVEAMLDDIAAGLGILPKAAKKRVTERRALRDKEAKARAEREAKEAADLEKARKATDDIVALLAKKAQGAPDVAQMLHLHGPSVWTVLVELQKEGRVERDGDRNWTVPAGEPEEDTDENAVFALLQELPGIPSTEIVKRTELKANRVYRILGDLEMAGRIKRKNGKCEAVAEEK